MTQLSFDQVRCGEVFCNATLKNGLYRLWGDEPAALNAIVECVIGGRSPERGSLTIDGINPATTPGLRAQIGSVLAEELHLPKGRVSVRMSQLEQLRGSRTSTAVDRLKAIGAGHLADRQCQDLTPNERRIVALALALALDTPKLLALHTPWAIADIDLKSVRLRLGELAERSVVVLVMPALADSTELVLSEIRVTERRLQVNNEPETHGALSGSFGSPPRALEFTVIASDATLLEAALRNEVTDARFTPVGPQELRIATRDSAGFSRTLVNVALHEQVQLYATWATPAPPGQWSVHAAPAILGTETPLASPSSNSAYGGYFPPPGSTGAP